MHHRDHWCRRRCEDGDAAGRYRSVRDSLRTSLATPATVTCMFGSTILVKTSGNPARLLRPVQNEIEALDRNLVVFTGGLSPTTWPKAFVVPRLCAFLFGIFGVVGALTRLRGLYGVISYSVAQPHPGNRHPHGARRRGTGHHAGWSCGKRSPWSLPAWRLVWWRLSWSAGLAPASSTGSAPPTS